MSESRLAELGTTTVRALRRNTRRVALEGFLTVRKRQSDRPAPDFVIVGAQRCGTTSLFRALAKHPAMMTNVINAKGIHYFDTSYHKSADWYKAHFPTRAEREAHSAQVGQKAIAGEASPYYMFHPAGAERMAKAIPDTKLIVLLRNPVKRAISHHLHMVWEGHESVKNIDEALNLEATRLEGIEEKLLADPKLISRAHQHFSYIARGHYAAQIEKLFEHFNRENVLVMTTEQLISDSQASLDAIQTFIGFETDPSIQLEKRNASSKFEPNPETVERLTQEYAESNKRLANLLDVEIPW